MRKEVTAAEPPHEKSAITHLSGPPTAADRHELTGELSSSCDPDTMKSLCERSPIASVDLFFNPLHFWWQR